MDFVTHAAVGALVGRSLTPPNPDRREGARYACAGGLAASIPDADHVLEWIGADAYLLHHRSATHSLLFLACVLVTVALLPGPGRGRRVAVVAAAMGSHLFLDLLTPFGTGLFWPFVELRPALDVLPIVAPWMIGLALAGLAFAKLRSLRSGAAGRVGARLALAGLAVFLAFQGFVAWSAAAAVSGHDEVLALAHPKRPWEGVAFGADADEIVEYRVTLDGQATATHRTDRIQATAETEAEVRAAMTSAPLRPLLSRYRLPAARLEGDTIVFEDVQYDHVSRDVEPAWIVLPRDGGPAAHPTAHLVVIGVQPVVWGGVVLLVWAGGRTWRQRRIAPERQGKPSIADA